MLTGVDGQAEREKPLPGLIAGLSGQATAFSLWPFAFWGTSAANLRRSNVAWRELRRSVRSFMTAPRCPGAL